MADLNAWLFAGCGLLVSLGVGFNQLMNRRYEIRSQAFHALQEAYDAVVEDNRKLKEERTDLQAALVRRVLSDHQGGTHGLHP